MHGDLAPTTETARLSRIFANLRGEAIVTTGHSSTSCSGALMPAENSTPKQLPRQFILGREAGTGQAAWSRRPRGQIRRKTASCTAIQPTRVQLAASTGSCKKAQLRPRAADWGIRPVARVLQRGCSKPRLRLRNRRIVYSEHTPHSPTECLASLPNSKKAFQKGV